MSEVAKAVQASAKTPASSSGLGGDWSVNEGPGTHSWAVSSHPPRGPGGEGQAWGLGLEDGKVWGKDVMVNQDPPSG